MSSVAPDSPVPIASQHRVSAFDCGEEALNAYLRKFALANHQAGYARTFVVCGEADIVCGYYTLTASQVLHEDASERLARGDRKSTRLNSSHVSESRMPSSA